MTPAQRDAPGFLSHELPPDQATPAQLYARLACRSVGPWTDEAGRAQPALTRAGRAAQCKEWAAVNHHRPALARDLMWMQDQYSQYSEEEA